MKTLLIIFIAGLAEVGWAIGLKFSDGFSKPLESIATVFLMILSFFLLSLALKNMSIGVAYATWTAIGVVGVAIIGIVFLKEPNSFLKMLFLSLIVIGILGLNLCSPTT